MRVTAFGKPLSATQIRELGFAMVNVATLLDRSEKQSAQAIEKPTPKELAEARAAGNRVRDGVATLNCLLEALR